MARFKISLKIQSFELQIEGSRDDIPLMTQAVGQQIAGMLAPAATIVEGQVIDVPHQAVAPASATPEPKNGKKRSTRSRSSAGTSTKSTAEASKAAVDWRHDPAKWGSPQNEWVTADKAIWLLYVVSKEASLPDMNAFVIMNTFNKHFRQAGTLLVGNVNRDLGKRKGQTPALVGENTTNDPPTWFLTDAGVTRAEVLVNQALGPATSSSNK